MSEQVKRYWPEEIVGTGELVVYLQDYDALHAEAEALRAQVSALQSDANSWQSGYDKGREDGAKAAEGWKAQRARDSAELRRLCAERDALRAELEASRGLLREVRQRCQLPDWARSQIDKLTATTAPEVRCTTCDGTGDVHRADGEWLGECHCAKGEQGERQEEVAWILHLPDGRTTLEKAYPKWAEGEGDGYAIQPLYTTPQPGPDVRALAASLYQACGAYDMPERILDALSAAANGEPFAHMIAGLLPCVPPVESGVEGLVDVLEQVRMNDSESDRHGIGATYWNNAVIACQCAIRDIGDHRQSKQDSSK